jgi:hypothetical protein
VIGLQMAEGVSGGVATGLEEEVWDLRRKKQAEEDRRLGRVRRKQQQLTGTTVLGVARLPNPSEARDGAVSAGDSVVNAGGSTEHLFASSQSASGSVMAGGNTLSSGTSRYRRPSVVAGVDGAVRIEVSAEMQAKLDSIIGGQVRDVQPLPCCGMPCLRFVGV